LPGNVCEEDLEPVQQIEIHHCISNFFNHPNSITIVWLVTEGNYAAHRLRKRQT